VVSQPSCVVAVARLAVSTSDEPSNKGMKQTKPSILELRSLTPVFDGQRAAFPSQHS